MGHAGYGGQQGYADLNHRFGYGYVTNYPSMALGESDIRAVRIRAAIYAAISNIG